MIQPNKYIVVSITPSPASYSVDIARARRWSRSAAARASRPSTLTSATTYLQKGQPYQVAVGLSQAVSTPLTIQLTYGGTAVQGTDYTVPAGNIVVPAGQTATQVADPDGDRQLGRAGPVLDRLAGARAPAYLVGTPSSTSVTITSSVVPDAHHHRQRVAVAQGGAAILHHHRQPGAGEEHLGQLRRRGHGPARPELRAAAGHGAAQGRARPRSPWCCSRIQTNIDLRADRHDRRATGPPGSGRST